MLPNDTQNDDHLGPGENQSGEGTLTVLGCGAYVFASIFVDLPELTSLPLRYSRYRHTLRHTLFPV